MASSRACCIHYIYNVPAAMDEEAINKMLRPLIRDGDEQFIKQKSLDNVKCRLVLTFEKPVELLEESTHFDNHQIFILPEMVEKTVVVLNKQWTDKLKLVKFNSVVLPGVSVVTNNGVVTLEGKKETVDQSLVKLQEAIVEKLLLQNVNAENSGAEMKTPGWQESHGKDDLHKNRKLKLGDVKAVLKNSLSHSSPKSHSHSPAEHCDSGSCQYGTSHNRAPSPKSCTDERLNSASFVAVHQSDLTGKEQTEEDPSGDSSLRHNSFGSHLVENDLHKLAVNSSAAQQKESKLEDATKSSNASPSGRNITATKVADYQKPLTDEEIDKLVDGVENISVNSRDSESPLVSDAHVENLKILRPPQASCSSSPPNQCDSHTPFGKVDQQNSSAATDLVLPQNSHVGNGGKLPDHHGGSRVIDAAYEHDTTTAFGDTQEILPENPSHILAQEMTGDVRKCQGNSEKTETVGSQSDTQDALSVSAGMNASNSAAADAVNGKDQRGSRPSTASNGNVDNASKPECFVIEEVIWQFILFSEPDCGYKDMFTIKLCEDDNKRIVLKGTTDNVQKFKTFYGTKQRLKRSVESRMQRIPQYYTALTFKNVLDNLAKNKVFVRPTTDPEFCEVIGKSNDLEDLSQAVKIRFPGDKAATKNDLKPHPFPPVSAVTTAAKAAPFLDFRSSQSANVDSSSPVSPALQAGVLPTPFSSKSSNPPGANSAASASVAAAPSAPTTGAMPTMKSLSMAHGMPNLSLTADYLEVHLEKSKIKVSVVNGDILKQGCEAIVCPTGSKLDNSGGLAKIIATAAGHAIQIACKDWLHSNKYLPVGEVMDTTAGLLPYPTKRIIHACGPNKRDFPDFSMCCMKLTETFLKCLVFANDKLNARSIAIPAISSGTFGVPYDIVAWSACLALLKFDGERPVEANQWLKDIKFVNVNKDVTQVMVNKFLEILQSHNSDSSQNTGAVNGSQKQKSSAVPVTTHQLSNDDYLSDNVKFCTVANRQGLSVVNVPRNGDSALFAIVDQLNYHEIVGWDVISLRREGVKHLHKNLSLINWNIIQNFHNNDLAQYMRCLETCNCFCDDNMLRGVAGAINREICLLRDNGHFDTFKSDSYHGDPLCIGIFSDGFYVSLHASNVPSHHQGCSSQLSGETRPSAHNITVQPGYASSMPQSTVDDFEQLRGAADRLGLAVVRVETGGDSALYAIIDQLNMDGGTIFNVKSLRQEAVKYLQAQTHIINDEILARSHDRDIYVYLARQSVSGTRCDEAMLRAIAEVVHRSIRVLHKSGRIENIESRTVAGKRLDIGLTADGVYVSLHAKNSSSQKCLGRKDAVDSQNVSIAHHKPGIIHIDFSNLLSQADERGLVIVRVPLYDGDCALHAIIDQLRRQCDSRFDAIRLREYAFQLLKSNREFIKSFLVKSDGDIDSYIYRQSIPGNWCDEPMLRSVAEVVNHNVHILHDNGNLSKLEIKSPTGQHLMLGLVGECHYVSLCTQQSLTDKDETRIIRGQNKVQQSSSNNTDPGMATQVQNKQKEYQQSTDTNTEVNKGITVDKQPTQDKTEESCPICMDDIRCPQELPCGHVFCTDCIDKSFSYQKKCPCCGKIFGELKGDQPEGGTMRTCESSMDMEGYQNCGSIVIDYYIPGGIQKANHPNPGQYYQGACRTAFLPNNADGKEICELLKRAFNAGLIFTVGQSTTSGRENVVTWNDIHHKTKPTGSFGYPDPAYLSRVRDELAAKGITSTPQLASSTSGQLLSLSNCLQSPVPGSGGSAVTPAADAKTRSSPRTLVNSPHASPTTNSSVNLDPLGSQSLADGSSLVTNSDSSSTIAAPVTSVAPTDFAPVHSSSKHDQVTQDKPPTDHLYPDLSRYLPLSVSPQEPVPAAAPRNLRRSSDTSMPPNMSPAPTSSDPDRLGSNFSLNVSNPNNDFAGSISSTTTTTAQQKGSGHTNLSAKEIGDF